MGERSGEKNGLLDWLRSLRLPAAARGLAAAALAPKILPAVLGPQRDLGDDPLGPYLGGGGDARVARHVPRTHPHEGEIIEWDRAEEASRTWRWLQGLGVRFEDVWTASDDGTRLAGHALACCPGSCPLARLCPRLPRQLARGPRPTRGASPRPASTCSSLTCARMARAAGTGWAAAGSTAATSWPGRAGWWPARVRARASPSWASPWAPASCLMATAEQDPPAAGPRLRGGLRLYGLLARRGKRGGDGLARHCRPCPRTRCLTWLAAASCALRRL